MDWKKKAYLIGGIAGLALGLIIAQSLIKNAEKENEPLRFDAGKGAKLGLAIFDTVKKIL